jgi:hypothetical protein
MDPVKLYGHIQHKCLEKLSILLYSSAKIRVICGLFSPANNADARRLFFG